MKKTKKFIIDFIILLLFAAFVFFVGWIQFYVKPGTCAVMNSKTSGILEKPVVPGQFTWRWERLLPTNTKLSVFDLSAQRFDFIKQGKLPGAEYYATFVDGTVDFSYRFDLSFQLVLTPEDILELFKQNAFYDQQSMDLYLKDKAAQIAQMTQEALFENPALYTESEIIDFLKNKNPSFFEYMEISSFSIKEKDLPDMDLYYNVKTLYENYKLNLDAELKKLAREQASKMFEEDRTLDKMRKFGELLKEYPEMSEYLKNGDLTPVLNLLK